MQYLHLLYKSKLNIFFIMKNWDTYSSRLIIKKIPWTLYFLVFILFYRILNSFNKTFMKDNPKLLNQNKKY